jgi:signal transduction histidine kinase
MSSEESFDKYLEVKRSEILEDISRVLAFTFFALFIFCLCKYLYYPSFGQLLVIICYSLSTLLFFYTQYFLSKRNSELASILIALIFFFMALTTALLGVDILFTGISLLTSFVILLIGVGEKYSFSMILAFVFIVTIIRFLQSKALFPDLSEYALWTWPEYLRLKSYWLFLFLLLVLYKGCIMKKICNGYSRICLERYKYLSNLEYKNRLLGKISKCLIHDIATPLSVLSGSIKLLEDSKLDKEQLAEVKRSALDSLLYLENLLDNFYLLLNNSQEKEWFKPDEVVRKTVLLLSSKFKKLGIEISCSLSFSGEIYGEEALFARAVLNVLINSIEELQENKKRSKVIEISSSEDDSVYLFTIQDNGCGIDERVLETLWSREITMKESKHLGLGLHFVLDTVENHFNGFLMVESKKHLSTKIAFRIPFV